MIRECIRLAECPSHFTPIHEYASTSTATKDYFKLADEVIAGEKEPVRFELPDFSLPEEIIYGPKTSHG